MRRKEITVTTDSGSAATVFSPRLSGKIHAIHYVKVDFTDGVDFTITSEETGETLWAESNVNASKSCYPRAPTHSQAGVAALYAASGTAVGDKPGIANDRVKIVIAQGGAAKSGKFHILLD